MSSPFVGQILITGFNFAPTGWALCDGQLMPISQNTALFSLLGTQYGGDGKSTFALPNLQGGVPLGSGQGNGLSDYIQGQQGGETAVSLLSSEIPSHTHTVSPAASADERSTDHPSGAYPARGGVYASAPDSAQSLGPGLAQSVGGDLPHDNLQPYLTLNFVIALQGVFPARS